MATASASPMAALQSLGQCSWMDFMSRPFLDTGELKGLIEEDNLQGVTSNPTIFDKAITHQRRLRRPDEGPRQEGHRRQRHL